MSYISFQTNLSRLLFMMTVCVGIPAVAHAQVALSDNLQVSGFGTISAAKSNHHIPILPGRGITDEWCFDCDTTLGVQADWQMSEKLRTTLQVVKRPQDTFSSPELERAQLEYNAGMFRVKVGRLRTPVFMMSEYYYVSSGYPWLRLPPEVYDNGLGLTYYEGVSADFLIEVDNGNQLVISPYLARPREEQLDQYGAPFTVDLSRALGFSTELFYDDNLVRFTYVNIDATQSGLTALSTYYELNIISIGISHYFGPLHFQAETMLADEFSADWYAGFDYQMGQTTPYIQYGQSRRTIDSESYLIGFRYDWTPRINTSVEWQRFFGRENVISGQFTIPQDPTKPFTSKVDLFSIGLSFTF
ncbi:sulfate ABC transporter permease [Vibrio sp. M260118]|uniref:sulfate ABC transporter permease n=1 Tax=Vibrio sp. M260118 TaxID=3020896 RepID=UPI002F40EDFF